MALAMLAIVWARIEVFGTGDIEDALSGKISCVDVPAALRSTEALCETARWPVSPSSRGQSSSLRA